MQHIAFVAKEVSTALLNHNYVITITLKLCSQQFRDARSRNRASNRTSAISRTRSSSSTFFIFSSYFSLHFMLTCPVIAFEAITGTRSSSTTSFFSHALLSIHFNITCPVNAFVAITATRSSSTTLSYSSHSSLYQIHLHIPFFISSSLKRPRSRLRRCLDHVFFTVALLSRPRLP